MDRASAIARLPEPYAVALGLHDEGLDCQIADRLDVDPAGVPALIRLAQAKLIRLLKADEE